VRHLAFLVVFVAGIAVFHSSPAKAEVVVRPQWASEQSDGQAHWHYYWRGQKYHVDPAGQHWAILSRVCVPVNNRFVQCTGGPIRQMAACIQGRLSNLADHPSRR
jgi:hypothetical protein